MTLELPLVMDVVSRKSKAWSIITTPTTTLLHLLMTLESPCA